MAGAEARVLWQRAASKRCLLHDDVKHSHKLSQVNSDFQGEKTHLPSPKTAEEKDVTASTDSWSTLGSEYSTGKKSNMRYDFNSTAHKDYQSALDESFMFRFSNTDEFDSLKAADVSLGSFADLQLLISGEAGALEHGYKLRSMPDQQLQNNFSSGVSLEQENIGECNEGLNVMSQKKSQQESETNYTIEHEEKLRTSFFHGGERVTRTGDTTVSREGSKRYETLSVPESNSKGKVSWRTADTVELAALVARQSIEHMENCDLPPSRSLSMCGGIREGSNLSPSKRRRWDVSRSMDRDLLFSLLGGHESLSPRLQNSNFSRFSSRSDPLPVPYHLPQSCKSSPDVARRVTSFITQEEQVLSSETQISGSGAGSENLPETSHGPQLLGEALCHSQTRAREAEKAAAQAFHEKERLARLLFREASLSLTYRQWINALQAENMSLRLHAESKANGRLKKSLLSSYPPIDLLSDTRWRYSKKERTRKEMQHHCNMWKRKRSYGKSDAVAGYTLGLAFAFGLGLAGAGLVLGWSMGWILFAPISN